MHEAPGASERVQIGLAYRHHPAVERLRELIAAGVLGRPLLIQAAICDEPANPEQDPRGYARRLRSLESIPPVVSDGVHACDRLNLLLGEAPVEVTGWALRTDPSFATANVNGGVLTYADGTVCRLEVVWLTPVLPRSQFVVTGPGGMAALEPPTFRLTVELADGTTETLEPPGEKTEVCFALQLERFVDALPRGHAARAGPRRSDREPRARRAHRHRRRRRAAWCPHDRLPRPPAGRAPRTGRRSTSRRWTSSASTSSVVFTYEGLLRPSAAANDSLAAWVAPAPERLVAFATVDPRDPGAGAEIERCVREHGMRGVKLHPWLQGFSAHEPGLQRVCETAGGSGSRSSSTTARRRSRRRSSSPRSRAAIRGRDRARPRRPARPLARGDRRPS